MRITDKINGWAFKILIEVTLASTTKMFDAHPYDIMEDG